MKAFLLAALLAGTPTLAAAQQAAPKPSSPEAAKPGDKAAVGKAKSDDFDIGQMMAFFDKMFPPQPDPAPARLALARTTAAGVLPNGTYAAMFEEMMGGLVDRVLSMNPGDFEPKAAKGKPAGTISLRQELAKDDPHFEERVKIARRVIGEELLKMSVILEPKLRDGLARSLARRFDERQLTDINAFLATDTGRAFGSQSMRLWVDPDVMRSMFQGFPDMIAAVPGALIRLEAATSHLPKPPKKEKKKAADEEAEGEEPAGTEDEEEDGELPEA